MSWWSVHHKNNVDMPYEWLKEIAHDMHRCHFKMISPKMTLIDYLEGYDMPSYGYFDIQDVYLFLGGSGAITKKNMVNYIRNSHGYLFNTENGNYDHVFSVEPKTLTDLCGNEWSAYCRDDIFVTGDGYIFSVRDFQSKIPSKFYINPYTQEVINNLPDADTDETFERWISRKPPEIRGINRYKAMFELYEFDQLYHVYMAYKKERFCYLLTSDESGSVFNVQLFDLIRPKLVGFIWNEITRAMSGNVGDTTLDRTPVSIFAFFDELSMMLNSLNYSRSHIMRTYLYLMFRGFAGLNEPDAMEELDALYETPWELLIVSSNIFHQIIIQL